MLPSGIIKEVDVPSAIFPNRISQLPELYGCEQALEREHLFSASGDRFFRGDYVWSAHLFWLEVRGITNNLAHVFGIHWA